MPLLEDALLVAALEPPQALPVSCVSSLKPCRERITQWHAQGIQGTTIHAALARDHGYTGSLSAAYRFVSQLQVTSPPEVPLRLFFKPGEAAQVDFGAGHLITHAVTGETRKNWLLVMTLCWSGHQYAQFVYDQSLATLLACHRRAFERLGTVSGRLIFDNAKCAVTKACVHDPEVQRAYAECAEGYGFRIDPCPPHDPRKKRIVASGVQDIKRSFLPLREFRSLADGNRPLAEWVRGEAGNRCHGSTRERPLSRP